MSPDIVIAAASVATLVHAMTEGKVKSSAPFVCLAAALVLLFAEVPPKKPVATQAIATQGK